LIKERAAEGLLVHGPIVTYIDEQAARSFARALMPGSDRTSAAGGSPPYSGGRSGSK
jgi:hypothetical protein